ncbi:MAG: hypothetical protein EXR07_09745 [Acetobacteraceae bacterium]|nr:hypothetical protein [Acetobacteraceae bacterium]
MDVPPLLSPVDLALQWVLFKTLAGEIPLIPTLWLLGAIVSKWAHRWAWTVDLAHALAALFGGRH